MYLGNDFDSTLLRYYGVKDKSDQIVCKSIVKNFMDTIETLESDKCFLEFSDNDVVLLFVSLDANGIKERIASFSGLLFDRYKLESTTVAEYHDVMLGPIIRTGCVRTTLDQIYTVLKIVFELQYHSFAAVVNVNQAEELTSTIMNHFISGLLSPKNLVACCNCVISNGAVFLHIIRGCDGYSINQLHSNNM